jgi:hypothetical protein
MSILRLSLFLFPLPLLCASTTVLFKPSSTTVGPFPTNALTSPDKTQKTGLVVQMPAKANTCDPLPALSAPSVCSNVSLLNQLDGFSVNPRIMVCFSSPINPATLPTGIAIYPVSGGPALSINQVIFDPNGNCAFAKPNQVLNQQSQYLLTVISSVQDAGGQPVAPSTAYQNCLAAPDAYCSALSAALKTLALKNVVAASLFTTMSATTWLVQARNAVNLTPPSVKIEATFPLSGLTNITWVPQDLTGTTANQENIPLSALTGVGSIIFALFTTLDYISPTDGTIHTTPTAEPISPPYSGVPPVSFHVFQPASKAPAKGYPVVVYGHGLGDNQFGAPTYIASTLAQNGFATLGFEITGHGFGPLSYVNVTTSSGTVIPVSTPGRGIVLPGNTTIGPTDGCIVPGAIAVRDCGRQTAVDLTALVQAIQQTTPGMKLDPTRIYYVGQSFGGTYGTLFQALDLNVTASVLSGAGGASADVARLAISGRPLADAFLGTVAPPPAGLFNVPPAPHETYFTDPFNDNYPFRDAAPVVNSIPGAMVIQAALEAVEWLGMLGDPLSFSPHLQNSNRLAGVPVKSTLFQFGFGDLEVPNPTESAVVAAAGAQSTSWLFRFDQAALAYNHPELLAATYPGAGGLPILPHRILANPTVFSIPAETSLSLALQQQAAAFFQSNGASNPNPNQYVTAPFTPAMNLFQVPASLPEQLNFLQLTASPALVPASGSACDGVYNGVFAGNITVASGQNCTFLGGTVTGNVAQNAGSLILFGGTVNGNVEVSGNSTVGIAPGSAINGNLALQVLAPGPPDQICGATIQGNLVSQVNAAAVAIGAPPGCPGNIVNGNVAVQVNVGPVQVFGNQISGILQCLIDTSITGGGNKAAAKLGQCAAF